MKILIDFSQIPLEKVGVGVYASNLLAKISQLDQKNNYYVLMQDDEDLASAIKNNKNFKIIKVKSQFFRKFILRCFLEHIYIPYLAIKYKITLIHSLHYSFPVLAFTKKVVTVHDLTFFKFPESHTFIKRHYFRSFIYLAAFFADKIITDSNSTSMDFLQRFKINSQRIKTIYLGKDELFKPNLDESKIEAVKSKYNITKDYFLFLGTIEPRKNIKNLILAFDKLLKENNNYQLVIAGKKGWDYEGIFSLVEELHLGSKVIFTGFIDEKDKPYLICGAKIFIYPSIYEGFGIPVLEALACGVPTITSNISSLPEVAGNAAMLINPLNMEELYSSIKKLLNDDGIYTQLRHHSIEQARKFSWEKTAQETIGVYNSLK